MGMRKSTKARKIKELMEGGMSASQVISQHPDLAEGFDELVKFDAPRRRASRGSGSTVDGPSLTGQAVSMERPTF